MKEKLQVIAYYLPQYHTIPENDEWWGEGFTEWVNVKKAKPLFKGHKQPNVPSPELGYYNLLNNDVRRKQTALAKEAGIDGFCYWHYWFGNGVELLEKPFRMMLADKGNEHGFCLGWANETWKRKQWRKDGHGDVNLAEQIYPGKEDDEAHFYAYLEAFKDERYMRLDGKPIFVIYRPFQHPYLKDFICHWNDLAVQNGLKGMCFIAELHNEIDRIEEVISQGCDYVTNVRLQFGELSRKEQLMLMWKNFLLNRPLRTINYKQTIKWVYTPKDAELGILPAVYPNWDHSPRSKSRCTILLNSYPELFKKQIQRVFELIKGKNIPIMFIKSWNEWGEGNYMEPDEVNGKDYIKALRSALDNSE